MTSTVKASRLVFGPLPELILGASALVLVSLSGLYSYLLFHSIAELFSIAVAWSVFLLAWNTRRFLNNSYLLFIGIALLFIGSLDLLHTLAFKGMGVFQGYDANLPTQLWIAARYISSFTFLIAPLLLGTRLSARWILFGYAVATGLVLASIFYWKIFPDCYIEGIGQTPFKKMSENIISLILLGSLGLLLLKREFFDRAILRFLVLSMLFSMGSELFMTAYASISDLTNLVGHLCKIIAFYFLYRAIVQTGLVKPYNLIFKELVQSKEALHTANQELERRVAARTAELSSANAQQQQELEARKQAEQALRIQARQQAAVVELGQFALSDATADDLMKRATLLIASVLEVPDSQIRELLPDQATVLSRAGNGWKEGLSGYTTDETHFIQAITHILAEAIELRRAHEQLRQLNADLEHRVRQRTAQLETANRELEAFSYTVSHDLRGPLTGIDGYSQVLLAEYSGRLDERGQRAVQRIYASACRMGQLIDDLLTLSRVTQSEMRRECVSLTNLAQEIAFELAQREPDHQVEFVIAEGLTANGDGRLLRVLLENLLGNAWKFSSRCPHPRIEVGVTRVYSEVVYFVSDNGVGFDMGHTHRLFSPFQRLHSTTEFPGTGIGLATVERIVSRHGGRVWAEAAVGQGASFYFTLPPS